MIVGNSNINNDSNSKSINTGTVNRCGVVF